MNCIYSSKLVIGHTHRKLEQVKNKAMCIVTAAAMAARPTSSDSLRYWLDLSALQYQEKTMAAKEFL